VLRSVRATRGFFNVLPAAGLSEGQTAYVLNLLRGRFSVFTRVVV